VDLDGLHLGVRQAVELLPEPHLPEGVNAALLQGLAAEGREPKSWCVSSTVTPTSRRARR